MHNRYDGLKHGKDTDAFALLGVTYTGLNPMPRRTWVRRYVGAEIIFPLKNNIYSSLLSEVFAIGWKYTNGYDVQRSTNIFPMTYSYYSTFYILCQIQPSFIY